MRIGAPKNCCRWQAPARWRTYGTSPRPKNGGKLISRTLRRRRRRSLKNFVKSSEAPNHGTLRRFRCFGKSLKTEKNWSGRQDLNLRRLAGVREAKPNGSLLPKSRAERGTPTAASSRKKILVGATGFEPVTPCAQGRCATRLRYAPTVRKELPFHYSEACAGQG
jgi:hypothetical protein